MIASADVTSGAIDMLTVVTHVYTPEEAMRLIVLTEVVRLSGSRTNTSVRAADLLGTPALSQIGDRHSLEDCVELLEQAGLVKGFDTLAGLSSVFLLASGKDAAAQFERSRRDPVRRMRVLQDAYLRWLYTVIEIEGRHPTPDEFLSTNPDYLGVRYSSDELMKAGGRLKENGFISGPEAWQYSAPLRPVISAKGRLIVEEERSVHERDVPSGTSNTVTVNGYANVSVGGTDFEQTMTVGSEWIQPVINALDAVEQALAALPESQRDSTETLLTEARLAVENKEPTAVRKVVAQLSALLGATTTGALGNILSSQLLTILPLLGG